MAITDRVKIRLPEIKADLLTELSLTATDRIKLRLGLAEFPTELESVAVEVVCAMYNRSYHEGVKTENVDTFSISFVDDILQEYDADFRRYLANKEKQENVNKGVVRFL
ncbi:phage head-tail connector protein [Sporolactobacillus shoreicorticis]|uniref:Phage head-tail connector protein n=1 Tax=Sporolactobacillus shoreicorticis TaxID=1923877 RepID=A0ABW5S013_9BACL|nr:phage head-tail connector protein [Sporolactobacillus shoreicorticis]MCO7128398.1 phage head-tail connector protein [Sporolactobacillus shoreicorticis]